MTATTPIPTSPSSLEPAVLTRILREGYGGPAWHGPDLASALADVGPEVAFERPAAGRHSIAEIVLHHAWFVRSAAARLGGFEPGPFPLAGEEWFEVDAETGPGWSEIVATLAGLQEALRGAVADPDGDRDGSTGTPEERFDLVVGITCHAVYHAGQIQLVKRLLAG